jgi:hypothetical protein
MHRDIALALTAEVGRPTRGVEFASDSSLEGAGFEPSVPREREKERGSTKVAESGSVPGSLAHYGLVGVSGTTAGTPSGLMLKARKVRGSLPGLPHWWTRPEGS